MITSHQSRDQDAQGQPDALAELADDVLESVEQDDASGYGDETQRNEARTTEEGLAQDHFIVPKDEQDV